MPGFYEGDVASAIVAKSSALGGTMTMADLASYAGQWMDVATTNYHGYDVATLPPPAQTWATDEMLNILESCVPVWAPGQTLASLGPSNPKYWHFLVEAKKLAYGDLYAYNADPDFAKCRSIACCRSRTRRRSAAGSIPIVRRDPLPLAVPTRAATRSCCRRQTDPAIWWRG